GMARARVRTAGSSAGGNSRGKRPSNKPRNSLIRNNSNGHLKSASGLLEALFDFYVDTKRAVLISQADDGDVAVHVVFHLNDLLLRGSDIRNISDGEVACNLLLDGYPRRRVLSRTG